MLVEGDNVLLAKSQAILGVELDTPADKLQVIIVDPKTGKDVASMDLGAQEAGVVPIAWDGVADASVLDAEGKPVVLADGQYSFRIVATRAGEALTDARKLSFDSVVSVTTNGKDGVKLNLPTAGAVTLADIKQVL